jgi:hypothetical protein
LTKPTLFFTSPLVLLWTSALGQAQVASPQLQFVTVAPCRIMDSRNATGPFGGPYIGGGKIRVIAIPSSACGVPSSAVAYSLNITVVPHGALAYLTVWPDGQPQPFVSTLNSFDGSTIANAAIVPSGTAGAIDAYADDDTDLIIDINGYFVPPAAGTLPFFPLQPCRVLDTRNANGTFGGPSLAGNNSRAFPIPSSSCAVPAGAAAYAFNVTAVPHGPLGYVTAWPAGQAMPPVSTLNSFDGTTLANAAIVPAGTAGAVNFFASNSTDLVVDINGYFALPAPGGLNFYALTPCRLVDTRNANGAFGGPSMGANTARAFALSQGSCGLPAVPGAQAYSLNVTAIPQGVLSYLSVWPAGAAQPVVSTLNAFKGQVVANAAIVPAGGSGSIDVYVANTTDVVIDTNGYFGPDTLSANSLTGVWTFTSHSTVYGNQSTGYGELIQNGNSLTGQFSFTGSSCATSASVTGTVNGTSLSISLNEGGQAVTFTGTVVLSNNNTASGTYSAPAGGCTQGDAGTWTGTRQ